MVAKGIRLTTALPDLASELTELARKLDRPDIADQIADLRIVGRCACGDRFCTTFYTSSGIGGPGEIIDLEAKKGMIILDLDGRGHISTVEMLGRGEYREPLRRIMHSLRRADPS